ncbi:MAG: hypothetical protein LBL84_02750 [Candidatus Nomurabacteria bacterium]|jgi:hypothetical protein|nr:hypothetical protein [Candidatus Nomurabacteria bacterium]
MEPKKDGNYWQHEEDMNLEPAQVEEPEDDESELDEPDSEPNDDEAKSADQSARSAKPAKAFTGEIINWDAKEHIAHKRGFLWYIVLVLVALGLLALSIFVIKSYTFAALIVVSLIALLVYVGRPPRDIHYSLSSNGLQVDEKVYDFDQFKAFGVLQDEKFYSLVLIPKKHFSPATTVYFPETQGEGIVDLFGAYLPMQEVKLDFIDRLIRKLRI